MNLIKNNDKASTEVRNFFLMQLMPLTKNIHEKEEGFFELKPQAESYYLKREETCMKPTDFEISGCYSFEDFEKELQKMWIEDGIPEFATLAPTLANLAEMLSCTDEQTEEVSPFLYVMF